MIVAPVTSKPARANLQRFVLNIFTVIGIVLGAHTILQSYKNRGTESVTISDREHEQDTHARTYVANDKRSAVSSSDENGTKRSNLKS